MDIVILSIILYFFILLACSEISCRV